MHDRSAWHHQRTYAHLYDIQQAVSAQGEDQGIGVVKEGIAWAYGGTAGGTWVLGGIADGTTSRE